MYIYIYQADFHSGFTGLKSILKVILLAICSGWRDTADSCYKSHAKATLDNAVQKLAEHRSWKFIWAETAFLSRWFSEASDENKQSLKR